MLVSELRNAPRGVYKGDVFKFLVVCGNTYRVRSDGSLASVSPGDNNQVTKLNAPFTVEFNSHGDPIKCTVGAVNPTSWNVRDLPEDGMYEAQGSDPRVLKHNSIVYWVRNKPNKIIEHDMSFRCLFTKMQDPPEVLFTAEGVPHSLA